MKMNGITKSTIYLSSFVFLLCFAFAWGSDISDDICGFGGSVPDPEYWDKYEFNALAIENENMPDYLIFSMTKIIGEIAVTDSSILKSPSCMVSEYVKALIKYYEKNKIRVQKEHKNLASLIDFIKSKAIDETATTEEKTHVEL